MDIYEKLKSTNINLSVLGFEQSNSNAPYYCTPKDADILAWAGVDGIHYCTIPEQGEIIFAVNPMNLSDCVHPIARNFQDLLSMLLFCYDMAALEQCCSWDEKQFDAFLAEYPASDEQQIVLNEIQRIFNIEPMKNTFSYVKKLQSEFDLSTIRYNEEYYDMEPEPMTAHEIPAWSVFYNGGFWGTNDKDGAEKAVPLNRHFSWASEKWHVPAAYICKKGMVIDFCVEIELERLKVFIDKWKPILTLEGDITGDIQELLDRENPLDIDFTPHLYLNGKELKLESSSAVSWIPQGFSMDDDAAQHEAELLVEHYALDADRAWLFCRCSFAWTSKTGSDIKTLRLKLERGRASISGVHFIDPSVGDTIVFTHPVFKTEHRLTVQEYERTKINFEQQDDFNYPLRMTEMKYSLEPALPTDDFRISDCRQSDPPKIIISEKNRSSAAIGIIGGEDGPTAIITGDPKSNGQCRVCSALTFETQNKVEWKTVFYVKLIDDIEITMLPNEEKEEK